MILYDLSDIYRSSFDTTIIRVSGIENVYIRHDQTKSPLLTMLVPPAPNNCLDHTMVVPGPDSTASLVHVLLESRVTH